MSDSKDIVSDLLLSTCNPLEPSRTPATKRPTSPGSRSRSKRGGTDKMTTSKTANGTMGSFKTSEIDSIAMSVEYDSKEFDTRYSREVDSVARSEYDLRRISGNLHKI